MSPTNRRAFTLIELLVVISIIAMLIGILLPVLSSARATARMIACASQQRQMAVATTAYTIDNKYALPSADWSSIRAVDGTPDSIGGTGTDTWSYVLGNGDYISVPTNGTITADAGFACPSYVALSNSVTRNWFQWMYSSYSMPYNARPSASGGIGPNDSHGDLIYNVDGVKNPSSLLLFTERNDNSILRLPQLQARTDGASAYAYFNDVRNVGAGAIGEAGEFTAPHPGETTSNFARYDGSTFTADYDIMREDLQAYIWGDTSLPYVRNTLHGARPAFPY